MRRITQNDSKLLGQLMESGTLLDPTAVAEARIAGAVLQIIGDGHYLENELAIEVRDRFAVRFSISVSVAIKNVSARRPIRLGDVPISVGLPFDNDFHLLAADKAKALGCYVLTPCGRQFPLELALNHRVWPGQALRPGQKLEGLLLGEGIAFTNLAYNVRELVPITVVVSTETDELYSSCSELCVSHYRKKSLPQNPTSRRRSLFARKDAVPV